MAYFVKLLGESPDGMPPDPWGRDPEMLSECRFPGSRKKGRPAPTDIAPGDGMLYYAVGGTFTIFGAALMESFPVLNPVHSNPSIAKRYPYAADIKLLKFACVPLLSESPLLADIDPDLQHKIGQISHFEIGRDHFEEGIRLLRRAKTKAEARGLRTPF
jgi:hypothetical protein